MPLITDLAATLHRPGFWTAYYGGRIAATDGEDGETFLDRVLGSDPDFDDEWLWGPDPYDAITDDMDAAEEDRAMEAAMAAGAVLSLPFPSGHAWSIRFSSSPGIYHTLSGPDGTGRISLGYDDPHAHLPILRWAEAWRIADHLGRQHLGRQHLGRQHLDRQHHGRQHPAGGSAPFPAAFVLPLLAPVTWAASPEEAAEAERTLAEAWTATGMIDPGHAAELARRLGRYVPDVVWRPDPVHGWTNSGRHSHRDPAVGSWSPAEFAFFRHFLDGIGDIPASPATGPEAGAAAGTTAAVGTGAAVRWRFDAGGPVEPVVTVAGAQVYCFTSADAKLRALDAATGEQRWYTGVMSRGFGRNAVTVADGTVHYAGGIEGLDLVAFGEHASDEADVAWVHALDLEGSRYTSSGAYSGWADTTPVVAGGRVFVAENSLHARSMTPSGPQPGWDAYLPGLYTPRTRPVVAGDRVYVAVRDDYRDTSTVQAFDAATGERVDPKIEVAGVAQDLVAGGGELLVAAGALTVFDAETGAERWSVVTERQWSGVLGVNATWVVGTTCRLPSGSTGPEWQYTVVGVDRRRQEVAWTFEAPGRLASSGVVLDGRTAYSVGDDDRDATLYAIDLTSGELRWQHALGRTTCLPAVGDGTVYVATGDGAVLAVRHRPD
ncbi:PQQ-binding-like beta-propeller repeat protein [Nonomuraea jiangxiensis]|uniref:Outer membrane protein assembly factor BamB, contains PQQ-like beta-propeller repeat n=1 Tax=Nonomuraea jiangxiensis TaxID=633440 RepID=A0A1G9IVS3_9ACTN|nr:PQQ-binding-like beta-propeller repeat protein [Nonomuraea jiangxiensis]SDL29043.1 Outer membrane protein assembly factor BamB, contains PQQ-like beta-propeller repeat [Nonomuraea jiangxiensis]